MTGSCNPFTELLPSPHRVGWAGTRRRQGACLLVGVWIAALVGISCTETNLYSPSLPRKEANRLAIAGRVCTEDPVEARFPVRIVLVADYAAGPLFADYDPEGIRIRAMRWLINDAINDPDTALAVVGYGGRARKLAPTEGNFTRNTGELFNALNLLSLAQPCIDVNQCRDYNEGIRTARTLIEGDLAQQPAGVRVLTQYVIVFVNSGIHQPLAFERDCCQPTDQACIDAAMDQQLGICQAQKDIEAVTELRETVESSGAPSLRFHSIHLPAEGVPNLDDRVQRTMEAMAFAGAGVYERVDNVNGFCVQGQGGECARSPQLDVLDLRTELFAKVLIATNLNALPGPNGPVSDSDADGLSDQEEIEFFGTSPGSPDTDGDGITDLVEILVGFNPFTADMPTACLNLNQAADQDLDGLSDCDEALLGTEPTLIDSDGDGMPDKLEVVGATDYVQQDAEVDTDGDGVPNGEELRQHSDPRSTDARQHLSFGYRYQIFDEGFVRELFASDLVRITGVEITGISPGTTAGLGTMTFSASTMTLRWQDVDDMNPGPPVPIVEGRDLQLPSGSFAPVQGDEGKFLTVNVPNLLDLPPTDGLAEQVRIIFRERQCLQYSVRNIQLIETIPLDGDEEMVSGRNDILLYFAEAPDADLERPGPFRLALIPVIFDPPERREPDAAIIEVINEEFIRPQIQPVFTTP